MPYVKGSYSENNKLLWTNRKTLPHYMHVLLFKRKNTILQWALKLNSAPAPVEMWDLRGRTLKVKL
jgi:hypothetical protein